MSPAKAAVRSFRFDAPVAHGSLEQAQASLERAREEMRGSETVREEEGTALDPLESLIKPLSARQLQAVNLLSLGKSVVATARTLGVGVSTVHRWKASHPLFKAELAQRQQHLFDDMIQKLRLTMSKAVEELLKMITGNNSTYRREAMWQLLKMLRPEKFLVPAEPTTAAGVLDEAVREARASRGEALATEITDEERAAAIPAQWRAGMGEVRHTGQGCREGQAPPVEQDRHAERNEASGAEGGETAAEGDAPAPRCQILRCAQDDGSGEEGRPLASDRSACAAQEEDAGKRESCSASDPGLRCAQTPALGGGEGRVGADHPAPRDDRDFEPSQASGLRERERTLQKKAGVRAVAQAADACVLDITGPVNEARQPT